MVTRGKHQGLHDQEFRPGTSGIYSLTFLKLLETQYEYLLIFDYYLSYWRLKIPTINCCYLINQLFELFEYHLISVWII